MAIYSFLACIKGGAGSVPGMTAGVACPKAEEDKSLSEHSSADGRGHVSLKPHALSWGCGESEAKSTILFCDRAERS